MKRFKYSAVDKVGFYASYFWYKLILPFEVKSPRFTMWFYEMAYTARKFVDYTECLPWTRARDVITTRFGEFKIRGGTADAANVSPAFERGDLNRLFALLDGFARAEKRVLFLDVGGDIGTYSVAVANRYAAERVKVICFEPIPASCALIRDNIARNGIEESVELMEIALMDETMDELRLRHNELAPGSSGVKGDGEEVVARADRLDRVLPGGVAEYDAIVMKIDVEGVEERVLRGATGLLDQGVEIHLMVEDFIDTSIIDYLENTGWEFDGKRTDYNSWWKRA